MRKVLDLGIVLVIAAEFFAPAPSSGQAAFQNLDFESANVPQSPPANYPNPVLTGSALPGWTALLGSDQQAEIQHNAETTGAASIAVPGPTWKNATPGIIDGSYSLFLQSGVSLETGGFVDASVEQREPCHSTLNHSSTKPWVEPGAGGFSVSFDGNVLSPVVTSSGVAPSGQPYTVYGADVAPYDGETGELEFSAIYADHGPSLLLDDISFSTSAVPEPSPVVLVGIAAAMFAARRRWVRKQ